jgi:flagellar protein FliL
LLFQWVKPATAKGEGGFGRLCRENSAALAARFNELLTINHLSCSPDLPSAATHFHPWQAMAEATLEETVETGAEGEGAVDAAAPPSGKKKIVMFAGIGVAFLLVASAGLYFTGMLDRFMGHKEAATDAPPPKPMVFFDLPDFLVNLNSSGNKKSNFLKLSVSLQLENQEDTARVAAMMPRVIDNFQIYLRELRIEDLRGSDGIYRLREELLVRVNAAVSPVKVNEVLFKEMLVQ